ncbi:sulfatase family protein [Runella slithyformis]|uniref:Sulfatase n=1 Tax=Runella slithyformis (strain ATCC 29530 / DSM 19594 / LMG 11500 / NCIMB 11436 / LSU 4) TaxID=761193 RepID=A0A7U3ZLK9_RUNSL|nr:sulfatase [Runella slithyformis]AEI49460.1 sulfatase [Runella slithyformis DSM 19594]
MKHSFFSLMVVCVTLVAFCLPQYGPAHAPIPTKTRPNILWITCEDMSFHLGAYGNKLVKTPNLDRLSAEGVRYTNAFATAGVCAPSRSSIITGMYQQSIGTQNMRTLAASAAALDAYPPGFKSYSAVLPEEVKCFPEYLRAAGYYCTNNSKEDYQFEAPPTVWDESSNKAHWRNRTDKTQPFFAVFNFTVTHESQVWVRAKEPLLVKPEEVTLPPYYPDVPEVRLDIARHLSNAMVMDEQAGKILDQLREDGLDQNTIVFFYSDHGDGLPFVKREIYDRGLRVPFIVKNPFEKTKKGIVDNQFISFVDLAPTVLSLTGLPIPSHLQGQAFLGKQKASVPRRYTFAARDRMDSEYDRVRTVRDRRYRYVRNYMPEKPYYQNIRYRLQQPSMRAILALKEQGKLNQAQRLWFRPAKPKEELYDCQKDPYELTNLAEDPDYQDRLRELSKVYEEWIQKVGDKAAEPEMVMVRQWWSGKEQAPITETPQIQSDFSKITLSCATKGASIGYKQRWKDPSWKVYTQPITASAVDSLYVVAHRIGYGRSPVAVLKR